jgi:tRNA pseudouridine55 synthase
MSGQAEPADGFLVIDKPPGMTSRAVVNRIGHTGTLDPLATGVLVVCIGAATRLADYVQAMGKSYRSRFRLGATSTSDDADGELTETPFAEPPTRDRIEHHLASFVGVIEQLPPKVSALKVAGQRAYDKARRGDEVNLSARPVRIDAIRLVSYEWPFVEVEVDCGKGTYIRSIARDLGTALGCGGMVQTLRRTRIGTFTLDQAIDLNIGQEIVKDRLRPLSEGLSELPPLTLPSELIRKLINGQTVSVDDRLMPALDREFAVFYPDGRVAGIVHVGKDLSVRPELMFRLRVV